jgi:hypothetical protein
VTVAPDGVARAVAPNTIDTVTTRVATDATEHNTTRYNKFNFFHLSFL